MKILVTGASGFVGQNLLIFLKRENANDILPISIRKELPLDLPFARHYIHLAGKAHDLKKTADDQAYFDVNYELTKKLYDRFLQDPTSQTFIFISSVKAAKDVVEGVLTEDVACNPVTPYGKSKLLAEQYILSHLPENKRVYILRPCMIHGPGNKGNLNLLYSFASKGLPYPLAAFDNQRSFLSVENLCFVINQLMEKPIPSGIYQVADDETYSTNDLIRIMALSLGKSPRLWKVPAGLITTAAKIGDRLHLPLNSERLQKLTESYRVSNQKIKTALGVDLPLSGEEGLMRTFESFKGG
ncbi:NAD-dependent epimerase/dehydratase family protein [Lunatimonas salinarum]|uniref:NAD-dependent epimerase/dehydratase family protein n=1 Tax=Lunatimonas salinarum TaxID=1774590 RepID=UPI001ADEE63C|nr:NAD-dependent epimerase/dehydratase family protein [Lunatimonas salinarum]